MSAKHVPAPWHVEAHGGGDYTVLEHDKTEVIASDGDLSDETMATARLIAAAPDLLEALTKLVEDLEMRSNWKRGAENGVVDCGNSVYRNARAAIAKAIG